MTQETVHRHRGGPFAISADRHGRLLLGMAKWLLVLNLLDGIFTLVWVEYFEAQELNLMMRDLAHGSPVLFMLAKLSLVSLGTLFLWRHRNYQMAVISLFVAFFAYFLVFLYHLQFSTSLLLR